jgi:hypothetical protein
MERPAPAVVRMSVRRNAHPGRFYTSLGNNMQSTLHTVNRAVADQCYARSIVASNRNRHNGDIFAVSASKRWPHSSRSKGRLVCVSIRSPVTSIRGKTLLETAVNPSCRGAISCFCRMYWNRYRDGRIFDCLAAKQPRQVVV